MPQTPPDKANWQDLIKPKGPPRDGGVVAKDLELEDKFTAKDLARLPQAKGPGSEDWYSSREEDN